VTKATISPALQEVRRGAAPDELEVIDQTGTVLILHAHGMHTDEQLRTRERALRLLADALAAHPEPIRPLTVSESDIAR
jgi:hypothetical protein